MAVRHSSLVALASVRGTRLRCGFRVWTAAGLSGHRDPTAGPMPILPLGLQAVRRTGTAFVRQSRTALYEPGAAGLRRAR